MLHQLWETLKLHLETVLKFERTIRRRHAKFEIGDENPTKETWDIPETVVENEVLLAIVENPVANTVQHGS